jgi:hypothetical protein
MRLPDAELRIRIGKRARGLAGGCVVGTRGVLEKLGTEWGRE